MYLVAVMRPSPLWVGELGLVIECWKARMNDVREIAWLGTFLSRAPRKQLD